MDVIVTVCIVGILTYLLVYFLRDKRGPSLSHLPGPRAWPLIGNTFQVEFIKIRLKIAEWSKRHGPIYRVRFPVSDVAIITGYDAITEALEKSVATGGRPSTSRMNLITGESGIVFNREPNAKWKSLRKITQRHIKQFGDGITRIEKVIFDISKKEMFFSFTYAAENDNQIDPRDTVRKTALKIVAYFIVGHHLQDGEPMFMLLDQMEQVFAECITLGDAKFLPHDMFPFMINLPIEGSRKLKEAMKLKERFSADMMQYAYNEDSLFWCLLHGAPAKGGIQGEVEITERDAAATCAFMLLSGISSTSLIFYALLNVLAHNKGVQNKGYAEIIDNIPQNEDNVTLNHKASLPYIRAIIMEILRYHTVIPLVSKAMTRDATIAGSFLPRGAPILVDLWGLHHDLDFWEDPFEFRPERFLDSDGHVLLADHPNRKHLLPFLAGIRVCVAEQFAMTRLFIWTANIIRNYEIEPASGNLLSSADPRDYKDSFVLLPTDYKIKLKMR